MDFGLHGKDEENLIFETAQQTLPRRSLSNRRKKTGAPFEAPVFIKLNYLQQDLTVNREACTQFSNLATYAVNY